MSMNIWFPIPVKKKKKTVIFGYLNSCRVEHSP